MSILTQKVLAGAPYDFIRNRRRKNYQKLDQLIGATNRLKLPAGDGVPYVYPYWATRGKGAAIREALRSKRIYTPTLWRECLDICQPGSIEYELSSDLLCIPIDQRYQTSDMVKLAEILDLIVKEC